jgi:hypothetical protein
MAALDPTARPIRQRVSSARQSVTASTASVAISDVVREAPIERALDGLCGSSAIQLAHGTRTVRSPGGVLAGPDLFHVGQCLWAGGQGDRAVVDLVNQRGQFGEVGLARDGSLADPAIACSATVGRLSQSWQAPRTGQVERQRTSRARRAARPRHTGSPADGRRFRAGQPHRSRTLARLRGLLAVCGERSRPRDRPIPKHRGRTGI